MTTTKGTTRPSTAFTTQLTTTPPTQPTTKLKIPTTKSKTLFTPITTNSTSALTTVRHFEKVTSSNTRLTLSTIKSITPRTTSTSNPSNVLKRQTTSITTVLPSYKISKLVKLQTVVNSQLKSTSKKPNGLNTSVWKHVFSVSKSTLLARTTTVKPVQRRPLDVNTFISTKAQLGTYFGKTTHISNGRTVQVSNVRLVKTTIPSALQAQNGQRTTIAKQTNLFVGHQTITNGAHSKTNFLSYYSHSGKGSHGMCIF
ncbi:mucin-17-like [Mytilus trossulus]|uniref:mucin-17-like n=1 Tax=Mytilus trossulus TaxID=6551 RepID=UPI003005973A